jgi:hypothetical protein
MITSSHAVHLLLFEKVTNLISFIFNIQERYNMDTRTIIDATHTKQYSNATIS